jgi:3-oxoadipate enol-lactonase
MGEGSRQDWIDVNGVSLRYALDGGGGAAVLVLIHEMGGSLDSWDKVIAAIPPGWTILRYDMRGAGLSEKMRGSIAMADMVEDLRQLLDALGFAAPVALAGCAVGAAVALAFAARHPERAARVMAMAPATSLAPDRRDHALRYIERLAGGELRALVEDGIDRTFPAQFRDDPAHFRAWRGRLLANDADSYAAIYRMVLDLRLEDELAAITCPVALVAGTLDRGRPPELVGALAAKIAGATFAVLETGHVMAVLTPALVGAEIAAFLEAGAAAKLKGACEKLD